MSRIIHQRGKVINFLEGSIAHDIMKEHTPDEYKEFEIKRVLDTITPKFIHRLNMEDIMNISGDPSVTLCGVTVPLDRFMNKLTEVHDRYMKEKGYGDNGAAFERFGVIQATAEEVAEKYKKQYLDNCDCAVKSHAQFMLKAQDTALELYQGDAQELKKELNRLRVMDPAMHIQVIERLRLLDTTTEGHSTCKTPNIQNIERNEPEKPVKGAFGGKHASKSKKFRNGFDPKKLDGGYR